MLMRSLVFANEYIHLIAFDKLGSVKTHSEWDPNRALELLVDGTPATTHQEIQNLVAPWRVSCALLAEPLRLYYQTVEVMPSLRREAIDEAVGAAAVPTELSRFRNLVFHLGGDRGDPEDTEYQFVKEMEGGDVPLRLLPLLPRLLHGCIDVRRCSRLQSSRARREGVRRRDSPRRQGVACRAFSTARVCGAVRTAGAWMAIAATIVGSAAATSLDDDLSNGQKEGALARGEESVITITVKENGWGMGRHSDIEAVLKSAAGEMTKHLREDVYAAIDVMNWQKHPEIRRDLGGPASYTIWLSAKDRYWGQYSYQFAHELCHLLANYEQRFRKPNQWFEEAICETAALFTLRSMGGTWREHPPYKHWAPYAKHLSEYADTEVGKVATQVPDDGAWEEWLRRHEATGRTNPYRRTGNRIIALRMLPLFEDNPEGWNAIRKLRNRRRGSESSWHSGRRQRTRATAR